LRDRARVIDVLPGAASALAVARSTVGVELQRHADDIEALGLEQGRRHRGIDAAGHGDDDAGIARGAFKIEAVEHCDFTPRTFLDLIIVIGSRRRPPASREITYPHGAARRWLTHLGPFNALEQQAFLAPTPAVAGAGALPSRKDDVGRALPLPSSIA